MKITPAWMIDAIKRREDDESVVHADGSVISNHRSDTVRDDYVLPDDDEFVIQAKGGGGGGADPNSLRIAEQNAAIERERLAAEERARQQAAAERAAEIARQEAIRQEELRRAEQARAEAAAREAQARSDYSGRVSGAQQGAKNQAQSLVTSRGLNYGEFQGTLEQEIARLLAPAQYGSGLDPYALLDTPSIVNNTLDREQNNRRTAYGTQVGQYANDQYYNNLLPDTFDDNMHDILYSEQYNPAEETLKRALARGQLTQGGYDTAFGELNKQGTIARNKINEIGDTTVRQGRDILSQQGTSAKNAAAGYTLGSTFNSDGMKAGIDTAAENYKKDFEGKYRGNLAGEQLFDINALLSQGQIAQGAQNSGQGQQQSLFDALSDERNRRNQQRGLGTQGVF